MGRYLGWAAGALAACALTGVEPAAAVAPGQNGLLAFDSDRAGPPGSADVYVIDPHAPDPRRVTTATGAEPVWSPDGARIAFFSVRDEDGEIYVMNADGSAQTRLTRMPGMDANPTWSPDSLSIAFQTNFPASQIHVMDATGANQRGITDGAPVNFQPDWSPDGRRIVFSTARDGHLSIYVMDHDGSAPRPLTAGPSDQDPVWSPQGSQIAFARDNDIYVVNADGTGERNLTRSGATDGEPCWSPDGRLIGFTSDRDGNGEIYTMKIDGTEPTRLTSNPATDTHCEWQPVAPSAGGRAAMAMTVSPRRVVAGRRVRFRFRLRTRGQSAPVAGATVRFAGKTARSDARGRAAITAVLRAPGRRYARAARAGFRPARAGVRVLRPR